MLNKALSVTVLSGLGVVLNFLLQAYLAYRFGARWEMDAFLVSTTFPQLANMVLIGSMAFTVLPSFVHMRETKGPLKAWDLASTILTLSLAGFLVLSAGLFLGAPMITALTAPGLSDQALLLSSQLLAVQAMAIVFWGVSSLLTCFHNGLESFVWPVISQSVNIVVTGGLTVGLVSHFEILALAFGILCGAIAQAALLFSTLRGRSKLRVRVGLGDSELRRIVVLTFPLVLGALFIKTDILVDRYLASQLPEGSISYLGYAWRVAGTISSVVCSGLIVTSFPAICGMVSGASLSGLQGQFEKVFRALVFVLMPIATLVAIWGREITSLLFERGFFEAQDSVAVSAAMIGYIGLLLGHALLLHLSNTFYALRDTVTPTLCLVVCFVLGVVAKIWLSGSLSFVGLAIGTSFYYLLDVIVVYLVLQRKIQRTLVPDLGPFLVRNGVCCAVMAIVMLAIHEGLSQSGLGLVEFILICGVGGGVYLSVAHFVGLGEGRKAVVYARSYLGVGLGTR